MAHHTTHRRILASSPEPPPPNPSSSSSSSSSPSSSMDPTLKKQNKPTNSRKNTDHPKPFYMSNPLSKLTQRITTHNKSINNPPLRTCKSMTLSADFDASTRVLSSSIKPKRVDSKEKVKKPLVAKKKVEEVTVKEKNKKEEEDKKEVKDLLEGLDIKRMTVPNGGGGGRRRSFGASQVELADFLATNGAKIVAVDMPPFMQIHAVDFARKTHDSLEKFTSKTLALTLKKEFDGVYGPAWHCIVGTSFGSFVTHSVGGFLYFSMDQKMYVLLFKTTVQRAD